MASKYTVEKIAEFVDGCSSSVIQPDVRDLVARHLLDSIGCAIGAMGAKVTQDIKAVVDAFGGSQHVAMHTLPPTELTGASKARTVMFRSAASHDGSASKYELKPRSVGAFFCPHHLGAPSRRCQHLRQRTGAAASASLWAKRKSCVGWPCIQARSWSRVLKPARKLTGPQTFFHTAKLTDLFVASSKQGCHHAGIFCPHF
jgi:hypothetical protein